MVKNTLKQVGSAHVVIVIILVGVLVGALGFVFWQSFIKTTQTVTSSTQTESAKDASPKAEELSESYVLPKENLSFRYPKTWELRTLYTNKDSSIGENRALLISPNNFALHIGVPSYGPNWPFGERPIPCPFDKGYVGLQGGEDNHPDACPYHTEVFTEESPSLNKMSIMAFETSWEKPDTLPTSVSLMLVKTGCKMPETSFCERPPAKAGFYLDIHGEYYKKISDENKSMAGVYSDFKVKPIEGSEFIKSQDVLTAIAILKSIKY